MDLREFVRASLVGLGVKGNTQSEAVSVPG